MTMNIKPAAVSAWHASDFTVRQLAAGLACDVEDVRLVLTRFGFADSGGQRCVQAAGRSPANLTAGQRVGFAVSLALHARAGMGLPTAADVVSGAWRICESVLATVDFAPIECNAEGRMSAKEHDPIILFAPHASEAVAVSAIDEFVDVLDGRHICWRRPRNDAYMLACELHHISEALKRENTPALQDQYLELVCRLREPADHVSEWIGTVANGVFRSASTGSEEIAPAMRQGSVIGLDTSRQAESYETRLSLNVSLAARSFKRRMLGLAVTDPFERTP